MSDLFLNENFEVEINENGDLRETSGAERVKQSVAVHVSMATSGYIGSAVNYEEKLKRAVTKALRSHSLLEKTRKIEIRERRDGGYYEVTVKYETSSFSFEVEEDL